MRPTGKPVAGARRLKEARPELIAELDDERNDIDVCGLSFGSSYKAWWRCSAGHRWQATVKSRSAGTGCPFCAGKRCDPRRSLAVLYPELARDWDAERNSPLTAAEVLPRSNRRVWWRCGRCDASWMTRVATRTSGSGCPRCGEGSAAARPVRDSPSLRAEWDTARNGPLGETPSTGSEQVVWWRCSENPEHSWQASIATRARGAKCPFCSGRRATPGRSLASNPRVAAQWHPTLNGALRPEEVLPTSKKRYWWTCSKDENHVWQASARNRTLAADNCPFCRADHVRRRSLLACRPDLLTEWDRCGNDAVDPSTIPIGSSRAVWWQCAEDRTRWRASVAARASGKSRCPACARRDVRAGSLAAQLPMLAQELDDSRNDGLIADTLPLGSNRSVWWRCDRGHTWRASVNQRARWATGCPVCATHVRRGVPLGVAAPDLINEWVTLLNGGTAEGVAAGSHLRAWWRCTLDPSHLWAAPVRNRVRGKTGCPYCAHKLATPTTSLAAIAPQIADEWHPGLNGELSPTDVLPYSHQEIWWRCASGHVWSARVGSRMEGTGCPTCAHSPSNF